MNKKALVFSTILGILILAVIILKVPAPMTQEQIEFDENVLSAQREKARNNCAKAIDIFETLKEEYPSTEIYLELNADGCYAKLGQYDKMFDSCLNSKLTVNMPARATICSYQLVNAGKIDEALSIWDKNIGDRPEEIFAYSAINTYEQKRSKINMKIQNFFANLNNPSNLTQDMKARSLAYIYYNKGDYDKALEYALQSDSNQFTGKVYLKKGDIEKAKEYFAKETNPVQILESEGLLAIAKKDYKTAKAKFNQLAKITPNSTKPLEQLGEIALIQKDYVSARKHFKKILAIEGYNENAKQKLKNLK